MAGSRHAADIRVAFRNWANRNKHGMSGFLGRLNGDYQSRGVPLGPLRCPLQRHSCPLVDEVDVIPRITTLSLGEASRHEDASEAYLVCCFCPSSGSALGVSHGPVPSSFEMIHTVVLTRKPQGKCLMCHTVDSVVGYRAGLLG